ncbi:MAG TPA: NosD domain-containing protein [Microbacterium sp.]|nr:NosD domain-containing protein [Microbacterium sp.]
MSALARRLAAASTVFAVSLATVLVAAPAHAADPPMCGDTIMTDTVLTADLVCDGSTDGLIIGAAGVTLDLGGHTISGPGAYATPRAGVRVAQLSGVTVTRGTVSGFQSGVVLDEAWGASVTKLAVVGNDQGINLAGGGGHRVAQNTVSDNGRDGIRLGLSARNTVTQNTVDGNVWGITVANGSSANVVSRNAVTGSEAVGLSSFDRTTGTVFSQNTVAGGWGEGIVTSDDTTSNTVSQNKSIANGGTGIRVANALVVKNTATDNGGQGIVASGVSSDGGGNKAAGNLLSPQCSGVVCSIP